MKFAFYQSLKSGAKKAFDKGNGTYRKYKVDGKYLTIDNKETILVIYNNNPAIKENRASTIPN